MARLIAALAGTIALVAFMMGNTHHVALSFVVGPPVRVRMIFLLMTVFFAGVLTCWLLLLVRRVRARRRLHTRFAAAARADEAEAG